MPVSGQNGGGQVRNHFSAGTIIQVNRKKIAQGLLVLLADSHTLYLMTHNFHWNVTGPQFNSLQTMFMQQYTEQWTARKLFPVVDASNDQPSADVLTQRIGVHEKTAWMLHSLLED